MLLAVVTAATGAHRHRHGSEKHPCLYTCPGDAVIEDAARCTHWRSNHQCQSGPSCSTLDADGAASDYLELMRRTLVGATTLFSTVKLYEKPGSFLQRNPRNAGLLANSGYLRMRNLQCLMQDVRDSEVPGEFVECGIWRGGAVIFMAGFVQAYNLSRTVWGFDSFMGVPSVRSNVRDKINDKGWEHNETLDLSISRAQVDSHIDNYDLNHRIHLVPGWFKDSLHTQQETLASRGGIALLRVDGDLYSSTMQTLTLLYPLVNLGGWVVLDDYAVTESRDATTAYRKAHNITEPITFHTGHPFVYPVARWQKTRELVRRGGE